VADIFFSTTYDLLNYMTNQHQNRFCKLLKVYIYPKHKLLEVLIVFIACQKELEQILKHRY